jgi:hypothetical protein
MIGRASSETAARRRHCVGLLCCVVPILGGTAVTSVGMSGALAAAGVPIDPAVVNQLVVSYLPALPGWFATEDLLRAEYR